MTSRARVLAVASAVVIIGCAGPAAAQTMPGYRSDTDAVHAQFRARAIEEFQNTVEPWTAAIGAGDLDAAMAFYSDDAFVYLGSAAQGRDQVRERLASWLDGVDDVHVGLRDFAASGRMSYASLRLVVEGRATEPDQVGTMVLVLERDGRDWRIRSQTVVVN